MSLEGLICFIFLIALSGIFVGSAININNVAEEQKNTITDFSKGLECSFIINSVFSNSLEKTSKILSCKVDEGKVFYKTRKFGVIGEISKKEEIFINTQKHYLKELKIK